MYQVPAIKLNNGEKMPSLGLKITETTENTESLVKYALDLGFRHIQCNDSAQFLLDKVIREKLGEGVVITREDLFISDQLTFNETKKNRLWTESCLDLVLIEENSDSNTYKKLKRISKSIGVVASKESLLGEKLYTFQIVQITDETAHQQSVELRNYCTENNTIFLIYFPTSSNLFKDAIIEEMAERYGKSTEQLLVKYNRQAGHAVLLEPTSQEQLLGIVSHSDWFLALEDISALNSLSARAQTT